LARYCPKCGSTRIKWFLPQIWSIYNCMECGYRGSLIIDDKKIAEKIRQKFLKSLKNK
jgi:Zn ribbon nucleic-acid-binding protein